MDATCTPFTMRLLLLLPNCRCAIRVPSGEYDGEFTRVPGAAVTSTVCVPADSSSSGADVLAARAQMLGTPSPTYNASGLLCSIDGYPSSGCGDQTGAEQDHRNTERRVAPDWPLEEQSVKSQRQHRVGIEQQHRDARIERLDALPEAYGLSATQNNRKFFATWSTSPNGMISSAVFSSTLGLPRRNSMVQEIYGLCALMMVSKRPHGI